MAYRSHSSLNYASRSNSSFTAPAGIADGDIIMIWLVVGAASPPTVTPPSGFSQVPGHTWPLNTTFDITLANWAWYKVASSEGGGAYTTTHATASTSGFCAAFSGRETTSPFTPTATTNTGTGATATATGVTPTVDDVDIVYVHHGWASGATNTTPPTGTTPTFTERFDDTVKIGYMAEGNLATAQATGDKTAASNSVGSEPWRAFLFAISSPLGPQAVGRSRSRPMIRG